MGFADSTDVPWTILPDWANGVQETLSWSTDVMRASATAVTQHRSLRALPRRGFKFALITEGQAHRAADMLLAGHSGLWQLPIWHDVQWLNASLLAGVVAIPCATAGYDFVAGGKALLYTAVNTWEIIAIATVEADHLALSAPTVGDYAVGARLYPLRSAQVEDQAQESQFSDNAGARDITFDIAEPCDWPLLSSPTLYLGHIVLDVRPDESSAPTSSNSRFAQTVDYGTSLPVIHDLPGIALRTQQSHWQPYGRDQHTWFRSLLYTLDGRRVPIWVPSFTSDLYPTADVAANSATLVIEWAGYTQFGMGKPNRQDVRIELYDGTVYYRRITNASQAGNTETLTLSSALSTASIAAASIRVISFMALCTSASDSVEIDHLTDQDGLSTCTMGWQAVVPDV